MTPNYSLTGQRARSRLKKLLGTKRYARYRKTELIIVHHGKRVFEIGRSRTEVYVFKSYSDYTKFAAVRRKLNITSPQYDYLLTWGESPVEYERWCISPDFAKLNAFNPNFLINCMTIHPDEEALARYLLAKLTPKLLRKKSNRIRETVLPPSDKPNEETTDGF